MKSITVHNDEQFKNIPQDFDGDIFIDTYLLKISEPFPKARIIIGGRSIIDVIEGNVHISEIKDNAKVTHLCGNAQVNCVSGNARITYFYEKAIIGYLGGKAQIDDMYDIAKIGITTDKANIVTVQHEVTIGVSVTPLLIQFDLRKKLFGN